MFSCEFCEVFKNTVFTERIWATASDIFHNFVTARRKDMITSKEGANFSIVINRLFN